MKLEAVLPLPEKIGELELLPSFYQWLVNEQHDIVEKKVRKVGRGYKDFYETIGNCKCAVRGKMVYLSGEVSHVPENTKYLSLALTVNANAFFIFTEKSNTVEQPNFTVKEV